MLPKQTDVTCQVEFMFPDRFICSTLCAWNGPGRVLLEACTSHEASSGAFYRLLVWLYLFIVHIITSSVQNNLQEVLKIVDFHVSF